MGALDTTGNNPGNWTVAFTPDIIACTVTPQFEVYKIVVRGASGVSQFDVYVDLKAWDSAVYGAHNAWDPDQPMLLNPGQSLYFYFTTPVTDGAQPQVSIWLRYDTDIATPGGHA